MSVKRILAGKPTPRFLSRAEAERRFHALAVAYRTLGDSMIYLGSNEALTPELREDFRVSMAIVAGLEQDGS